MTEGYEVIPSWEGGPLREFADHALDSSWRSWHDHKHPEWLFSRNYVCQTCRKSLTGIYEVKFNDSYERKWLCWQCREDFRPKQSQPPHLRRGKPCE